MRIVQITDLHVDSTELTPYGIDVWAHARWAIEASRATQPDGVVISGDVALHMGNHETYTEAQALFSRLDCPWHLIPGNHDNRALFSQAFGPRYTRSIEAPWLDYTVTDTPTPMVFLDSADAVLSNRQLIWLQESLRTIGISRRIVWIHHPVLTGFHRYMDGAYRLKNADAIRDILAFDNTETVVFCGHYHYEHTAQYRNITQYCTPSTYMQIDPSSPTFQVLSRKPAIRIIDVPATGPIETTVTYRSEL